MKQIYNTEEILREIEILKNTFDIVRLVDPIRRESSKKLPESLGVHYCDVHCYAYWNKGKRCENCISEKALLDKTRYTKFDFVNDDIYYIVAKYVNINGYELILEVITKVDSNIILHGDGYNKFAEHIENLNQGIYKDELTGVYNRKYLNEKLPALLLKSSSKESYFGLAIIDIDYFKKINDMFGHLVGDDVVFGIANILSKSIRERDGDFITRFGGDEFILVINNISGAVFQKRLESLIKLVYQFNETYHKEHNIDLNLTLSIGAAMSYEIANPEIDGLISLADERLYQAKENGKDRIIFMK